MTLDTQIFRRILVSKIGRGVSLDAVVADVLEPYIRKKMLRERAFNSFPHNAAIYTIFLQAFHSVLKLIHSTRNVVSSKYKIGVISNLK